MPKNKIGKIIIPAGVHPWPHELRVAELLAKAGYSVKFIPETNLKTPDIYINNIAYEIKSPTTNNPKKIIRNVKRALEQSPNVIIDSSRIKGLHDSSTQRLLKNKIHDLPGLKKLLFINRHGQIIDIMTLA